MNTKQNFPVEVFDNPGACCFVRDYRTRSLITHGSKQITYGQPVPGENGETENVLIAGEKVGFRWFSYQ